MERSNPFRAAVIAGVLVSGVGAECAAVVLDSGIRSVSVILTDTTTGGLINSATDTELISNDALYMDSLSATIGGSQYSATVGMQPSGIFGVAAESLLAFPHLLEINVTVLETYINIQATAVDLSATFIVVSGEMDMVGNENTTLSYSLGVGEFPFGDFDASGVLTGTPSFSADFTESGDSLGATQAVPGGRVDIPFQSHTVDLGRLAPGETLGYLYSFSMELDADVLEIADFAFIDPGDVTGFPLLGQVSATPVPLPAALALLLSGLAALWRAGVSRAPRPSKRGQFT